MKGFFAHRIWVIAPPYLWMLVFFALPFGYILKISLAESVIAMPPYSDIWSWTEGQFSWLGSLDNYRFLLEDDLYYLAYFNSVRLAAIATLLCLFVAYPMAFAIARMPEPYRSLCLLLVILPSWTSFLIRIYAWIGLLKNNGLINQMLLAVGLLDEPLLLLHSDFAIYLGIVYGYLPFMVLPIYAVIERHDLSLLEAAADLGAKPLRSFLQVTLPLSIPGIAAGSLLVFVPALGEFVVPELLGGSDFLMIGRLLWTETFQNRDWPLAAAVSIALLFLVVATVLSVQWVVDLRERPQ